MHVTLSIDDQTLARARHLAQRRGVSLNEMIRDYLETLTASDPAQTVAELERLWSEEEGDSGGWTGPLLGPSPEPLMPQPARYVG
jgi:CRISPR/Cas system-associated protein Csm6